MTRHMVLTYLHQLDPEDLPLIQGFSRLISPRHAEQKNNQTQGQCQSREPMDFPWISHGFPYEFPCQSVFRSKK